MGIKTYLTIKEAHSLFPSYKITTLTPSVSGIVDTTYITEDFIIKKYERDIQKRVDADIKLLCDLRELGLNTPVYLEQKAGWYLYEKLKGTMAVHIELSHIRSLAGFLAKFHRYSYKRDALIDVYDTDEIEKMLEFLKHNFYAYYKKLSSLKNYHVKSDGMIHGDIFKDNTLFQADKIAVFDFIDAGRGSFVFDIAVALVGFGIKKHYHTKIELFLKVYNQHAPIKQSKKELLHVMEIAAHFYTLKRIYHKKKIDKSLLLFFNSF
jgi:homoserine kinase type II